MTKDEVKNFFIRYEQFFMQSLHGEMDMDALPPLYAQEFIAASPLGVKPSVLEGWIFIKARLYMPWA